MTPDGVGSAASVAERAGWPDRRLRNRAEEG